MSARLAQIVANTVEVVCPYCGGSQPSPDNGSFSWMPEQVMAARGIQTCSECDAKFNLQPQTKAQVNQS